MTKSLKKIIPLLILLLITNDSLADNYEILRVVDGDTIEISAPYLPYPLKPTIHLRISGLDTPEKTFRAQCTREASLAEDATSFTKQSIKNAKEKIIIIEGEDKYFRLLGDIILDGKSLRELLLEKNFAKPYYGAKKPDWCEKEH